MTAERSPPPLDARAALFLDFDGTLAPIQNDPDTVSLPDGGADRLLKLSQALDGALVAVSGRDIRDLSARLPVDIWRAGGHGLEICAPGEVPLPLPIQAPGTLLADIEDIVADFPGTRVESKGPVIAVHYRGAPESEGSLLDALNELVENLEGYAIQQGKMVLEAKPARAHKGRALEHIMTLDPFLSRVPVMIGDDTTDEDAMASALRAGGLAIKVGAGETVAPYRLADPDAVWAWLGASSL
ncbi:MAG: trehalose-phosphatase [Pseudomonadota bacterium]